MSNLTEDQKLVKLGLRAPNQTESAVTETKDKLQSNIAEKWATFQENFEDANLGSWSDFETWLDDNGFTSTEASNIRSTFESKYSSFSDFKDNILNQYTSWSDFENDFASNTGLRSTRETDTGLSAAGIKVYEEAGVGRSGQSIPAGGVEVYGKEVHFSQSDAVRDTKDESAGADDPVVWDNLVVDPNRATAGVDTVDVSCDVTNNTSFVGNVVAELIVDDGVVDTKTRELEGNTTITISFDWTAGEQADGSIQVGTFAVGISKAGTEDVTTIYPNL